MNRRPISVPILRVFLTLNAAIASAFSVQAAPGFVYESDAEFQTLADVDGDGFADLIVVDKATGQFRVATGSVNGSLTWRVHSGNSGLPGVTGFSAGPLLDPRYDSLLFSEPFANRIQLIDARNDQAQTEPVRVATDLLGPQRVTAMNLPAGPSGYDSDLFDIVYHATLEAGEILSNLRNGGSLPSAEFGGFAIPSSRRPNRIVLESGSLPVYGVFRTSATATVFNLYHPKDLPMRLMAETGGLPANADYVHADFADNGRTQFLFYAPGSAILRESKWDGSTLTPLVQIEYSAPVASIRVIESAGVPELLIIHSDGTTASRVSYDGAGALAAQENFTSSAGETFSGAASIGDHLHLLSGTPDGRSESLATYLFSTGNHSLVSEQRLTPLQANEGGASVLLFDKPPLTHSDAVLLSRIQAGPWTSAFALTSSGAEVVSETYRGVAGGLGGKQTISLAGAPATTGGGLTNQISPDLSLLFQVAPVGAIASQLRLEPGSGRYSRAVRPILTVAGSPATLRYRTDRTHWEHYDPANPPTIVMDTTFYAVAENAAGTSNIVKADYVFSENPGSQDSNGDGLPDYVAQYFGLDPLASSFDSDGDGFTDLEEILAGTDPRNSSSKPSREDVAFSYPNSFDLVAAPGIPDPAGGPDILRSFAAGGGNRPTRMTMHQPNGFYLGHAETTDTTFSPVPASEFSSVSIADPELFAIAITETNFPVNAAGPKDFGRQVAAIIPIPEREFEPFSYEDFGVHGGTADLESEALEWVRAAQSFYRNLERETVIVDPVGAESTLALLLVEHYLGKRLHARGVIDRATISLTPFRANENPLAPDTVEDPATDRDRAVTLGDLRALQNQSGSSASYKIKEIVAAVDEAIATSLNPEIEQLIELAKRLYTTSATHTQAGALRQPFDALRRFIRTGDLANTGYENAPASSNFPGSLLASAGQGIAQIEAILPQRTLKTIPVYYDGNVAAGCQTWREVLYTHGAFDPENPILIGPAYSLIDEHGNPFPIARAFPLTAGSVFEVTGFVESATDCGDLALELVSQPDLLFLRNTSPTDLDGDLIPDSIQRLLAGEALSPFADSDRDGYTDLQEILAGSDPTDRRSVPLVDGVPAPVLDPSPPQVKIETAASGATTVSFDYPAELLPYIDFQLFSSADLQRFSSTGLKAAANPAGQHMLTIAPAGDREFYIFRMSLK